MDWETAVFLLSFSKSGLEEPVCVEGRRRDLNPAFSQAQMNQRFLGSIGRA